MTSLVFPSPTAKADAVRQLEHALKACRSARPLADQRRSVGNTLLRACRKLKLSGLAAYPTVVVSEPPYAVPLEIIYSMRASLNRLLSWRFALPLDHCIHLDPLHPDGWYVDEECRRKTVTEPQAAVLRKLELLILDVSHLESFPWDPDDPAFGPLRDLLRELHKWREGLDRLEEDPTLAHKPPVVTLELLDAFLKALGSLGPLSVRESVSRLAEVDSLLDQLIDHDMALAPALGERMLDDIEKGLLAELEALGN